MKTTNKRAKFDLKPLSLIVQELCESRLWPSWAVRPNEPSGSRGRKDLLNRASALVTTLSLICQLTSEDIKHQLIITLKPCAFFFALACEKIPTKTQSIESRCVIGPENIPSAGPSVHLSDQRFYTLGSEGVKPCPQQKESCRYGQRENECLYGAMPCIPRKHI